MLVLRSAKSAEAVPGLRHNGMRGYEGDRSRYWVPAMRNVDFDIAGLWPYNFCIGEVQCALGSKMLERLDAINAERKKRAERFIAAMAGFPELIFQKTPEGCGHSWHLLASRYDGERYKSWMIWISFGFAAGVQAVAALSVYRYPMFQRLASAKPRSETDRFSTTWFRSRFSNDAENQFSTMICLCETVSIRCAESNCAASHAISRGRPAAGRMSS